MSDDDWPGSYLDSDSEHSKTAITELPEKFVGKWKIVDGSTEGFEDYLKFWGVKKTFHSFFRSIKSFFGKMLRWATQ